MGANNYYTTQRATSMEEAYQNAREDAIEEYGHQEGYSGQINASCGFLDKTKMWKDSGLTLGDFVNKHKDNLPKGEFAWGISREVPVGNTNKVKSVVEHVVFKGTRKWELIYVPQSFNWEGKASLNKADAIKEARAYSEKNRCSASVIIKRRLCKDTGSSCVANIKYKSNPKEKNGLYIFFGVAPC